MQVWHTQILVGHAMTCHMLSKPELQWLSSPSKTNKTIAEMWQTTRLKGTHLNDTLVPQHLSGVADKKGTRPFPEKWVREKSPIFLASLRFRVACALKSFLHLHLSAAEHQRPLRGVVLVHDFVERRPYQEWRECQWAKEDAGCVFAMQIGNNFQRDVFTCTLPVQSGLHYAHHIHI